MIVVVVLFVGGVVVYRNFLQWRVLVTEPKLVKRVLSTNARNYTKPGFIQQRLSRILGTGLLTTEGAEHTRHRTGISPAFHWTKLQAFVPEFSRCAMKLADLWDRAVETGNGQLHIDNIHEPLSQLTLDILGLTAFGYDFHSLDQQASGDPIYNAYTAIFKEAGLSLWVTTRT